MLSRQRSTCFLLDPPRVKGGDFVEMLRLVGYPGAGELKGEDFDWLSEGNEEAEAFLGSLCGLVDQRNVLTDEQLVAYHDLSLSGNPLFELDELQKLSSGRDHGDDDEDLDLQLEEHKTLEELEAEVQNLKNLRSHRLHIRNKCESLGFTLLASRLSQEKYEKEQEKNLNRVKEGLAAVNSKCNTALSNLSELTKSLDDLYNPTATPDLFLSNLDIESNICMEQRCFEQIQSMSLTLLAQNNEEMERRKPQLEMEEEAERLRTAWTSQRVNLSMALGTMYSKEEALTWVHRTREDQSWNHQQIPSLEREIQSLEAEVEVLQTEHVPGLVCVSSIGPHLSTQKEWIMIEGQRLIQVEKLQAPMMDAMINQMARLQFIEMGLREEMKFHEGAVKELETVKGDLASRATEMARRLQRPRDLWVSAQMLSPIRIASKDHTAVRLNSMMTDPGMRRDFLPKYEALGIKGEWFVREVASLRKRLGGTLPQISRLETDCSKLSHGLMQANRNLHLRDPALAHGFDVLNGAVSQFNQWCLDCLRDLERRKHCIQTSRLEQERKLYIFFYRDPAALARAVQELEQRVRELTSEKC